METTNYHVVLTPKAATAKPWLGCIMLGHPQGHATIAEAEQCKKKLVNQPLVQHVGSGNRLRLLWERAVIEPLKQ